MFILFTEQKLMGLTQVGCKRDMRDCEPIGCVWVHGSLFRVLCNV